MQQGLVRPHPNRHRRKEGTIELDFAVAPVKGSFRQNFEAEERAGDKSAGRIVEYRSRRDGLLHVADVRCNQTPGVHKGEDQDSSPTPPRLSATSRWMPSQLRSSPPASM